MNTNTGGPAFPTTIHNYGDGAYCSMGVSIRDYFAAKAMQAMISSPQMPNPFDIKPVAEKAYVIASAMLEAREA